jgi:hypothetical protein
MSTKSDVTRTFPPCQSGTKASAVPVCWLIIAGHLEETLHRQNAAESHPLYFLGNVNTCFLQISTARHLKNLPDRKKLTTYLNSEQKMLLGSRTLVRVTKSKNYFVIQCYMKN